MMDFPIPPSTKRRIAEEPNSNYVNQDKTTPSNPKIHFVYANTPRGNRRVTVAYTFDNAINSVRLAFAECNTEDNFAKKIGRGIAVNRLKNGFHTRVVPFHEIGVSYTDITHYVTKNIKELTRF
jgi:hypothetical protein